MILPENFRPSRDAKMLLREVDAALRAKDVKRLYIYRQKLERKWWEPGITALMFIAGLGFVITIYKLIPAGNPLLFSFVFFWFALFVFTLFITIEVFQARISALCMLYEILSRELEDEHKQQQAADVHDPK
jgi:hypothetical protein